MGSQLTECQLVNNICDRYSRKIQLSSLTNGIKSRSHSINLSREIRV